ncbi:TRAP transporter small permease [Oceanicella actignis]|uniref:TRAP transporter small permease protein n=1 Tax=Oceanicella actignis TaxID=1189325 RepID=A0A1M7SDM6_9RHOB|nr:TRAP transporter small permease [Oceanicella actignis]SET24802.1 TRAP-type C4-dicarboxylate transport system, small permease component [Oceanicella actignis]SHN56578.1 TRAP-type C4-dicarboxylate transport system, small permease component [Oceanicella actignis]
MQLIDHVSRGAAALGAWLMVAAGAMLTYEVVARYFFVRPTIWAAELSQLCLIWGCLMAMAGVLRARRHVTVNALTDLLPLPAQRLCAAAALVCVIAFSAIVAWWGWQIFHDSFVRGRTTGSLLDLPSWVAELPVPLGFALLALQAAADLARLPRDPAPGLGSAQE